MEEGVGDHRHQCVSMQTGPGATFEVIEAKFLLVLLMPPLTDPSGFDGGGELLQARIGWQQIRPIVFLLSPSTGVRQRARPRRPACTDYDCRACGACGHPQREYVEPRRDMSAGLWFPAAN